ncbi:MAG: pyruvate, phosphate dikinase [Betaproteobacteria bacterium]
MAFSQRAPMFESAMELFVHPISQIDATDTARFGGKATGLARMAAAGIRVPPAFVIGTDGYRAFRAAGGALPDALVMQTRKAMQDLEAASGRRFGGNIDSTPLLVSVRSGAQVSMPGMMDTVLNLGISACSALALARSAGGTGFAIDTWLRFWRMFSDIVLGLDVESIFAALEPEVDAARVQPTLPAFERLEQAILRAIEAQGVGEVRADPQWQLLRAIAAVFESWDSRRARAFRSHHGISDALGTAVTVQAMVFGNLDARSGSGVAFTRNPNTGERALYGEFLLGRQGEDLVSGSATPQSIGAPGGLSAAHQRELQIQGERLERIYRDAVDIEFTVEGDHLYFLQVRPAKRTAPAAVRIAAELVDDGIVPPAETLKKVSVEQLKRLLRPAFEPGTLESARVLTQGIGASPGHAFGVAMLDSDRAAAVASKGERVILMRPTTSPQDIRGMLAAKAIVTARGGALSHAAVVSRALDIPCIVGCESLEIDLERRSFSADGKIFEEGTPLSVDGTTGKVYGGVLPLQASANVVDDIDRLLRWSDEVAGIGYWASAVTGMDATAALRQGPRGLGVIALTDLLITAGTLGELIDAINDLSQQPDRSETHERLRLLAYEACRHLFIGAPGVPIDLRLPNLGSPRAQRMIGTWAALAPRLFLPLGLKGLYVSLLRGIAEAARESSHDAVTPLIAGITGVDELSAFQKAAASIGVHRVGASLQSPAALMQGVAIAEAGHAVWVDIREIIRTFNGYPSALSFGDDVFETYVADGYLKHNPRTELSDPLRRELEQLVSGVAGAKTTARLGVDCGDGAALSLIEDLYRTGFRAFSVPVTASAGLRLALGHLAAEPPSSTEWKGDRGH